jgi:hypothetical protein
MATLPSTLPTAKPLATGEVVKHEITRVCHFNGDTMVLKYLFQAVVSKMGEFCVPYRLCWDC